MIARAASLVLSNTFSEKAVIAAATTLRDRIGGNAALGFLFATEDWLPHLEDTLELVRLHGHVPQLVGCSGWGVIGNRTELEAEPGLSLLFLAMPENCFEVFSLDEEQLTSFPDSLAASAAREKTDFSGWLILASPVFGGLERWLMEIHKACPGVPVLGGLASAASGEVALFQDGHLISGPVLAIGCKHPLQLRWLISQGCRPIGDPFPITKAEGNLILEIGNVPAYQTLESAFLSIPAEERVSVKNNLFVGLAVSEYIEEYRRGDFLIRNILGADPHTGALAIGASPRVGQTIQFQLRDARSAHEDLVETAADLAKNVSDILGLVLFSCAGRGRGLFGTPNHDAAVLAETLGEIPLAGFFCNGEIGPVGGRSFVHGYTASAAVLTFRE